MNELALTAIPILVGGVVWVVRDYINVRTTTQTNTKDIERVDGKADYIIKRVDAIYDHLIKDRERSD